jgi:hypothetical protein
MHHGYPHFQPSRHSGYGAASEDVAIDAGKAVVASSVAGGTAAVGLIAAAGGAATVPVAGWIAAAGLAVAAGVVALVASVKAGKVRRKEAIAIARQLKLPNPEKMPGFIVAVLKMKEARRAKLLARLKKRADRLKKRKSKAAQNALAKIIWKIKVLEGVYKVDHPSEMTAEERRAAGLVAGSPRVPDPVNAKNSPHDIDAEEAAAERVEAQITGSSTTSFGITLPPWGWAAVAVGGVAVLAFVFRGRGGSSAPATRTVVYRARRR